MIIFSRKLKQSWVSEDIVTLPWVSVLIATKSISFDQKVTTFDRFWWSIKKRKKREMLCFLKQIVDLKRLYFWISCWSFKGNRCCMDSQIWNSETSKKSSKSPKQTNLFTKKSCQMIGKFKILFLGEDSGDPSRRRH